MYACRSVRALIAVMLCVCANLAYAGAEEVSIIIPNTEIPPGGDTVFLEVDQFDPSGGRILQRIDFDLVIDFSGTMGFENLDPDRATTFELALFWGLELWDPDPNEPELLIELDALRVVRGLVDPFDGEIDFGGFSGVTFDVMVTDVGGLGEITDPKDFPPFEGTGTVLLPVTVGFEGTAEAGNTDLFIAEFWDVAFEGELTVTYTYIPEPVMTGWLLLAGFALLRRRR